MEYARLAAYYDRLAGTSSRLGMAAILVELLDEADADVIGAVVHLLQGRVAPDWEGLELGLADKLVLRAVAGAAGVAGTVEEGAKRVQRMYHEGGDLGLAAEAALQEAGARRQATLFGPQRLSVQDVHDRLLQIARAGGHGSQETKQRILTKLLLDASPAEARYIVRTVSGRLRLGVADMTFLDALAAWHLGAGVRSVQEMEEEERQERDAVRARLERAYDLRSDLALVARTLAQEGLEAVDRLGVAVGTPLRPMAAERLRSLREILEKHGGTTCLELKYDGLRMQVHAEEDQVRIFSRRLEDLTGAFPDVVEAVRGGLRGRSAIVEGECVAIDPATGRMRPFQELSRRRGRKTGLGGQAVTTLSGTRGTRVDAAGDITKEVPVVLYLFDCLAADGKPLLERPFTERRRRIPGLLDVDEAGPLRLSHLEEAQDEATMEAFFQKAVQDGGEGIMAKRPDHPYKAGSRGFDWIKFKHDYLEGLADSMDLVVVGAFHGRGRRAGWYGALLMACRDPDAGTYATVCKLGTGFDDATLMDLKGRFAPLVGKKRPPDVATDVEPDVWIEPSVVMEVQAAELTLSPVHHAARDQIRRGAGLAARFPRFTGRWRDDKGPGEATTAQELVRLYEEQARRGGAGAARPGGEEE